MLPHPQHPGRVDIFHLLYRHDLSPHSACVVDPGAPSQDDDQHLHSAAEDGHHIPTWGSILSDGRAYLERAWWIASFPGIAIFVTVMGINLFGDWLRDYLDPRLGPGTVRTPWMSIPASWIFRIHSRG